MKLGGCTARNGWRWLVLQYCFAPFCAAAAAAVLRRASSAARVGNVGVSVCVDVVGTVRLWRRTVTLMIW